MYLFNYRQIEKKERQLKIEERAEVHFSCCTVIQKFYRQPHLQLINRLTTYAHAETKSSERKAQA